MKTFFDKIIKITEHKRFIYYTLFTGIVIRLIWAALFSPEMISDDHWFYTKAIGLAEGHGYVHNGNPTAYYPVGFIGYLAFLFYLFGSSLWIIKISNILLYTASIYITYLLARKIGGSEKTSRIALLLMTLFPDHIAYINFALSELLYIFIFLSAILLMFSADKRILYYFFSGILFGSATLIKPHTALIPLLLIVFLFRDHIFTLVKRTAVIYFPIIIIISLWTLRNYQVFEKPVFISTSGGINLLMGNNEDCKGGYTWNEKLEQALKDTKSEPEKNSKATELAINYILENPLTTVKRWPAKLVYLLGFGGKGFSFTLQTSSPNQVETIFLKALVVISQLYYMAFYFFAIFVIPAKLWRKNRLFIVGIIIFLFFACIHMIFYGGSRYHFPIIPFLIIYASVGIEFLVDNGFRNSLRKIFRKI